ncbi:MAG TPA: hypothetical protein VGQ39_12835 [Pyrinomonadaceae bacterium]|jgi:hypothetical protein|nr:hypothetical protein [Pyrinomonadaceae bacterium]
MSLLIGSAFVGASSGQKPDPFANVPASQRDRLKSRLTEFVDYHRTKQWERVYDLLAERSKQAVEGGLPKDLFLKKKLYSEAKKFTPTSIQKMDDDWWMIWGCATYQRGGAMESALEAYFQDGNWFFSDIWSSPPCIDCTPRSCKH